jgi:hypothetical protein
VTLVVREFCEGAGVTYTEVSVIETYIAVVRHLDSVGVELRG